MPRCFAAYEAAEGRPPVGVVSCTGLGWTSYALEARRRGVLERRPLFTALGRRHVVGADGTTTSSDTVLRPQARADGRVHLIGYGASQSTVGADRAGRATAAALIRRLDRD
ncbi:hypothetical protein EV639_11266 [Rathayibacter tanaceti]|uniref:Pyridine nucleotide-disulfide oxidoreductase n=2 Tax=Rathayibacter tanaceti TaxID=1671680 RepID=A0AAE6V5I2_9MICO|nr:hypothetical protein [Rathayibacter tanaceti]QHC54529.1 hypothetical protein GSU10_01890 [Rathayibacter tanaceti]TCO33917.1 hypothetical protein EV639_11266 [Rathayibacter tanaceti]